MRTKAMLLGILVISMNLVSCEKVELAETDQLYLDSTEGEDGEVDPGRGND
jgi:hypothetical protein